MGEGEKAAHRFEIAVELDPNLADPYLGKARVAFARFLEGVTFAAPKFPVFTNTTGQAVREGEALMDVYSPELITAQQEYLIATRGVQTVADGGPDVRAEMQRLVESALQRLRNWDISEIELQRLQREGKVRQYITFRSKANGVVLEKLVDPNELVTPQSFGGTRGPSTALIAMADPKDLQVEIDLNEADLSKISLNQKCRVSPEAYPDKIYEGYVAEVAPEANRAKGTLQIKVQVRNPDKYLTPELSAKVEFLK